MAASAGKKPISPTRSSAASDVSGGHAERKRGMLYGRRKGPKLSAHQQHLLDHLLPQLELHLSHADPHTYFSGAVEEVWLEVGFGGGEHLIWQAQHHPDIGLIGAEPYVNGVVKLLSQLEATSLANIRIYCSDAREILEALPDASLGRVFILFPDPWPKRRHHKRRFIQMDMLNQLARVLKPSAELRFASDDADYAEWTLEHLMAHPAFDWTATRATDWQARPDGWPPTRYEAKELHGKPVFLKFARR
ncbi:MAG: tRNA (guanosine(46)-N7)-methyltransferase TrmB [Alphaproteobacteria bacterium]|nr:tRNA (guanosine(46)-N7)-methyltransferase TrmB [Alphaproteobacteria bacterium]MBV9061784.1 tRNA (guanosine(46)-N7)-methyltransferase TrmB [Alphaproteobacteria bacterium]